MAFALPPLPYDYSALEPHIDTQTMQLHHDKHHAAYVTNLNNAVQGTQFENMNVEELMRRINEVPENIRTAVRNNGGGHVNHTMFWEIMKPNGGGQPTGALADAVNQTFGGFDQFKTQLNDAATKRFGSGWGWLVADQSGKLQIISTANQDSPFMDGHFPIMGIDVWEHAYYLKYQNRRADYLNAWWNVANWDEIARRFERAKSGR
ncbi:MAG TPA: superoxide dismutase [Ktedonobacterales bacterium]|nr:superoxide dismutase [Ktedonobacterales bacterium]